MTRLWRKAIFFYNQSLPLVFTANVIFWMESTFHMLADLQLIAKVHIIRNNSDDYNWRFSIIYVAHVLPAVVLLIEMSMNRLRIPVHHIFYNMLIVAIYVAVTYCYQILDDF